MNEAVTLDGRKLIVLTEDEFRALIEDAGDIALAEEARAASAGAPLMPAALLEASLDGSMHPLTAWRKAAGLTQAALADRAGIRVATLSDIEGSKIDPRLSTMKALATALGVDIDDICP